MNEEMKGEKEEGKKEERKRGRYGGRGAVSRIMLPGQSEGRCADLTFVADLISLGFRSVLSSHQEEGEGDEMKDEEEEDDDDEA